MFTLTLSFVGAPSQALWLSEPSGLGAVAGVCPALHTWRGWQNSSSVRAPTAAWIPPVCHEGPGTVVLGLCWDRGRAVPSCRSRVWLLMGALEEGETRPCLSSTFPHCVAGNLLAAVPSDPTWPLFPCRCWRPQPVLIPVPDAVPAAAAGAHGVEEVSGPSRPPGPQPLSM